MSVDTRKCNEIAERGTCNAYLHTSKQNTAIPKSTLAQYARPIRECIELTFFRRNRFDT